MKNQCFFFVSADKWELEKWKLLYYTPIILYCADCRRDGKNHFL